MSNQENGWLNAEQAAGGSNLSGGRSLVHAIAAKVLFHGMMLVIAAIAFVAYEHFKIRGESTQSLACLLTTAGCGLLPVRALMRELFMLEGKVLHLVHGVGGLVFSGLALGGFISGGPMLTHAALAPFAIMGAAQAIMHQNHPRNPEQAEALRRFATSLPEVERFTKDSDLTSPANVSRAIAVLTDLMAKAQALGETELRSDPGFQSALGQATSRFGLSLALDTVDRAISKLSANPAAAKMLPTLRKQLANARKTIEKG